MNTIFEANTITISSTMRKGIPAIDGVLFCNLKDAVLGPKYELSLVFVGTSKIRTLNRIYRNKDYATDILSFSLDADLIDFKHKTGEIFINPQKAKIKAKEFGRDFKNYIQFLFVHGLHHLAGHEHETNDADAEKMEKAEAKVRKKFGI